MNHARRFQVLPQKLRSPLKFTCASRATERKSVLPLPSMMVTTHSGLYASAANGIGTISLGQVSGERPKNQRVSRRIAT